jgi:hypothetical protein
MSCTNGLRAVLLPGCFTSSRRRHHNQDTLTTMEVSCPFSPPPSPFSPSPSPSPFSSALSPSLHSLIPLTHLPYLSFSLPPSTPCTMASPHLLAKRLNRSSNRASSKYPSKISEQIVHKYEPQVVRESVVTSPQLRSPMGNRQAYQPTEVSAIMIKG